MIVFAVKLTKQNVDCKAGVRSFNQMVFRNTTHMGSGFVIRTQTATLHQRLGLRWMIDAWENTVIFSEIEPKSARQVQEHKTISLNNIKNPSVTYYPKNSHATKHNILHIWRLNLLRINMMKILKDQNYSANYNLHAWKCLGFLYFGLLSRTFQHGAWPRSFRWQFPVESRKKLMCKRARRLLRRSVHRGTYKPMVTPTWSTRTRNSIVLCPNFFWLLLFPYFSGSMLGNHLNL